MRYMAWVRSRSTRLFAILLAVSIYFLLLILDALRYFPHHQASSSFFSEAWLSFGFSAFVALMFLAVGSLVWLYARSRLVALLLFCFSFTMMVTFAVETGASLGDLLLSTFGGIGGAWALSLFLALLLLFPRSYLSSQSDAGSLRYRFRTGNSSPG